jgi:hypothetical protein
MAGRRLGLWSSGMRRVGMQEWDSEGEIRVRSRGGD